MALALGLMAATIALWDVAVAPGEGVLFGSRIALFVVAGAFGGTLRSIVYLLAFPSLTPRERRQWRLEAMVSPPLGGITGMLMYFLVVTAIVDSPEDVSLEAQYLISLGTGALSVNQFGKWAERGLMRSALSRSGIIGTEGATSVPVIERIDRLLEARVQDLTYTNWRGLVSATLHQDADGNYTAGILFEGLPDFSPERLNHESAARNERAQRVELERREDRAGEHVKSRMGPTSSSVGELHTRYAAIATQAGDDRDVALFSVRARSTWLEAVHEQLAVEAPRDGEAVITWLDLRPGAEADVYAKSPWRGENLVLEIAQGPKIVQILTLPMPEP